MEDKGTSSNGPYRNYGFDPTVCREQIIPLTRLERENQLERDDLGLLADTIERLDAEIETDLKEFPHLSKEKRAPDNLELLAGAMKRVAELEKELKTAQRRAQRAELELQYVSRNAHATFNEPLYMVENKRLRSQIMEMEQFLADYGYIWVGNDELSSSNDSSDDEEEVNWPKIVSNIEELNELCGKDTSRIVQDGAGGTSRLQKKEKILILLYTRMEFCLVKVLSDHGFFPTELQTRFPDGLIFNVKDFHSISYSKKFPGLGKSLQEPVIRTNDPRLIETDISNEMSDKLDLARSGTRISTSKGITIRVRTLDDKFLMIRMRPSETVRALREYIADKIETNEFRILTLSDGTGWTEIKDEIVSLEELKLGPRAAIQLAKPQSTPTVYEDLQRHISNLRTPRV
ncbi:Oidioi.mRNA.OKI2018_I69.XSR.g16135.t1.cds [Oikopleura dioica]|uniref:Oidioi.mRNA.OKI2018_I69.XSR.g16135.t1.cds n=1 Tax=Oikopleura dioica TaxID=34765 RepID=A0ABN7SK20_OIKDI|nr:Oidioi.mRNA.OKI2018_I69.XSR.g16135.t1.cds [Oikopleura dioica]